MATKKEAKAIASDGYAAIELGPWAEDKLSHLENYCSTFNTATHKQWQNRIYIDLFSGPGKCIRKGTRKEYNGSPLLALNCRIPFSHYFFNDINPAYIEALRMRTQSYGYNIEYINKDCNAAMDEILNLLPRYSVCFAYIDPYYLEIRFDTIKELVTNRRVDLLITFHIGNTKRNLHNPNLEMKQFFPDNVDWRELPKKVIQGRRLNTRPILDAYEGGLIELGYPKQYMIDHILERNSINAPLYYLIFASKHRLGAQLYQGVINRQDAIRRQLL